eukprot:122285-Prorocentrum_minimum.AAC.2
MGIFSLPLRLVPTWEEAAACRKLQTLRQYRALSASMGPASSGRRRPCDELCAFATSAGRSDPTATSSRSTDSATSCTDAAQ